MAVHPLPAIRRAPGPKSLPLIGVLPQVRRDPLAFVMQTRTAYGDVVNYRLGPLNSFLISHPDGVRQVLQENVKNYTKDHFSYGMVRWIAGNGLLTSRGDFWLRQRRLAQPAFHRQRIAAMGANMVAATRELADEWQPAAENGQVLDIGSQMMGLTLRIVSDALFGSRVPQAKIVDGAFNELSAQLVDRFRRFNIIPPVLPTAYDRRFRAAISALDGVVYAIIAERRASGEDRGDLLSMLMQTRDEDTGETMNDRQLRDEVLTMLLAGHETTATTLSWVWAMLDQHPDVAARLHAEVDALGDRPVTAEDLPRLAYTRMVIDETTRLYPPVYIFSRKVAEEDQIGGYRIPAGSSVDISPYATHRHPDFWENPEAFDPERFSVERSAARPRFAYFPFSGGPRQCIGNSFALMEAQLILATLAQRYRLRLQPGHTLTPDPLITLRPRGGLPMQVVLRTR